jgi:Fic family protein
MAYIWQASDWPAFRWNNDELVARLGEVRHEQGRLLGRVEALGFKVREATLLQTLTQDVVKTSAIEGERLDEQQVRSSLARRLGMKIDGFVTPDRSVEGIVHITLDATMNCREPLTAERLFQWHAALFPTGRSEWGQKLRVGAWRDDTGGRMEVVSGSFGREKVEYVAPPAKRLEAEMSAFLDFFNAPAAVDPVIKAAVAHLWFVAIHPFDDGNGRITRAIADMTLARTDAGPQRLYSMSAAIEGARGDYYDALKATTTSENLDLTNWIKWFVDRLGRAVANASATLDNVLFKADFWQANSALDLNARQTKVLNLLLDGDFEGKLTSTKFAKITKTSQDTAARDIADLVSKGLLRQGEAGGRSTAYEPTWVAADPHLPAPPHVDDARAAFISDLAGLFDEHVNQQADAPRQTEAPQLDQPRQQKPRTGR